MKRLPPALLMTSGLLLALTQTAAASTLVRVSGPSPYAGCALGGGFGAVNYPNAEVEPYVAVNPANPRNVVGVWQQDRWSDGGAHGIVAGFSVDGGITWGETPMPFDACAAGGLNYERAADPWVSIGRGGTAYAVAVDVNESNANDALAAVSSGDGGKTWGGPRILIADVGNDNVSFKTLEDKPSVTADPTRAGVAYAVWTRIELPTINPDAFGHIAFTAFHGDAFFSRTTDGGQSWSSPRAIVVTPERQLTESNQVVVDPRTGTLYDLFAFFTPPNNFSPAKNVFANAKVAFVKSSDGGDNWTQPQVIAAQDTVGVTDPNTGQPVRTGSTLPEAAIDAASGQLYVVWQDARFNGGHFDEVAISTSSDGGATWSAPTQVNTNTPSNLPGFTPAVAVNSAGTVGVTYYDFRSLGTKTTTLPTDYWFRSLTATSVGLALGPETHISGPFDMLNAPFAGGFFVGDYEGIATIGATFLPFFVQTNDGNTTNRTDVFTTAV